MTTEEIKNILLHEAEKYARIAHSYWEEYLKADHETEDTKLNLSEANKEKAYACYSNLKALGIITEKERRMYCSNAFSTIIDYILEYK